MKVSYNKAFLHGPASQLLISGMVKLQDPIEDEPFAAGTSRAQKGSQWEEQFGMYQSMSSLA